MSFAVLEIPDFPLHARLRLEPASARPTAIFSGSGRRARLAHLNAPALAFGLRVEMSGVQALGLCPDLLLWPRHDPAEREADALLLAAAWRFSPRVEATAPGLCTAALAGRDQAALRGDPARARAALALQGLPLRIGIGPTPGVARFAAFHADPECWVEDAADFLRPLPVQLLDLTADEAVLFDRLGLRTLGDLARLPVASLAQRLGERGAQLHARAVGEDKRPLRTATPPARFAASYELEHPAETLEPLLFLLRRFVDRLAAELAQAGLVAETLHLTLHLEDETRHDRAFRLPQPTARPDALFQVLEHHLGTVRTAAAVTRLLLELDPAESAGRQEGLFESALRDPHQFYDTLARAAAVLGPDRLGAPRRLDSHRPDAVALAAPPAVIPELAASAAPPVFGPPLRRFRPAPPAAVELDADAPAHVHCPSARFEGVVRRALGPWHRSGDWWDPSAWTREEWDVELAPGGLYRLARTPAGWFVEGVYD